MDMVAYNPPSSLWRLIEEHISPHETQEIRSMLGESLIEQSLELHQEVETLLDIWRSFREESQINPKSTKLPEPPEIRERLIQEIVFFVKGVKDKANNGGVDPEKIISKHNSGVINYALQTSRSGSSTPRPQTARSDSGRDTPMISSVNDRLNNEADLASEVVSMNDKLNFLQFDEVVSSLRDHLQKEIEHLLKDITFLQQCLEDEACFQDGCSSSTMEREPTLSELREERSLLEKEMLSSDVKPAKPVINGVRNPVPSSPGSSKFRPAQPLLHSIPSKPSPLKASHQVTATVQNIPCHPQKDIPHEKLKTRPHHSISPGRIKVVSVNKVLDRYGDSPRTQLTPSPPGTSRSTTPPRPSSAMRFRKMVLDCREGE
ncbi:hypothetical protein SNE40_012259 [Patella caerulea]|uniref:Coiled-coil domain-containing protein 24 n=1 Tax=Patella caerulea TaxID=87958 RepID=A0AAN8JU62_PATCE